MLFQDTRYHAGHVGDYVKNVHKKGLCEKKYIIEGERETACVWFWLQGGSFETNEKKILHSFSLSFALSL